jgi:hypothetical protein
MYSMGGAIAAERLTKAVRSLDHRGPDSRGEWIDASRRVGLGHARLSIIHLAGGAEGAGLSTRAVRSAIGSVPTWLEAFATTGQKTRGILAPSFIDAYADQDPLQVFVGTLEVPRQLTGRHPVHQAMYMWCRSRCFRISSCRCSATGWKWRTRSKGACPSWITTSSS